MATLPSYVTVRMSGYGEEFDPSVERTEMERGIPKQRCINTRVMATLRLSFLFPTSTDAANFEEWYFDTIKRIGWFDMTHPRTGGTISARFPGGNIGEMRSISGTDHLWQRDLTVEYLR